MATAKQVAESAACLRALKNRHCQKAEVSAHADPNFWVNFLLLFSLRPLCGFPCPPVFGIFDTFPAALQKADIIWALPDGVWLGFSSGSGSWFRERRNNYIYGTSQFTARHLPGFSAGGVLFKAGKNASLVIISRSNEPIES